MLELFRAASSPHQLQQNTSILHNESRGDSATVMTLKLPQLPLEIVEAIADELAPLIINGDLNPRKAGIFPDNVARIMGFLSRLYGIQMPQTRDIISLRLACRQLEQKTFRVFARTCFGFLRTDLSARSIQRLKDISAHDQIRKHLHTLHVTLFLFSRRESHRISEPALLGIEVFTVALSRHFQHLMQYERCSLRSW